MLDQERLPNRGLNSLFWETREWVRQPCVAMLFRNASTVDIHCIQLRGIFIGSLYICVTCQADGGQFFYFPLAGELRLQPPPVSHGGMLCEEMGLGKTLEVFSLILKDKQLMQQESLPGSDEAAASRGQDEVGRCKRVAKGKVKVEQHHGDCGLSSTLPKRQRLDAMAASLTSVSTEANGIDDEKSVIHIPSNATLIVVPPTLLAQWVLELEKSIARGCLSYIVYPEHNGHSLLTRCSHKDRGYTTLEEELAANDVVLTTYSQLSAETTGKGTAANKKRKRKVYPRTLLNISWRRIVLDECQVLTVVMTAICCAFMSLSIVLNDGEHAYSG